MEPQPSASSNATLLSHLHAIGDLVYASNFNLLAARNAAIKNFLLTGTTLGGLLFVGSGLAKYHQSLPPTDRIYAATLDTKVHENAFLLKGAVALNIPHLMGALQAIGNVVSSPPSPQTLLEHAHASYQQNSSATLKWGGAALLASLAVGLLSFFRKKSMLDQKTSREIGGHLRESLHLLQQNPQLHNGIDCNDLVRNWTKKIEKRAALEGLGEQLGFTSSAPARR